MTKCCYLITSADEFMSKVGTKFIRLDRLADRYFSAGRKTLRKIEHLNDAGEWVE